MTMSKLHGDTKNDFFSTLVPHYRSSAKFYPICFQVENNNTITPSFCNLSQMAQKSCQTGEDSLGPSPIQSANPQTMHTVVPYKKGRVRCCANFNKSLLEIGKNLRDGKLHNPTIRQHTRKIYSIDYYRFAFFIP